MSQPKGTPKPKAWMRHSKSRSGYIIRMRLDNGYKTYRPESASCLHIGDMRAYCCDCPQRYWNRYYRAVKVAFPDPAEKMEHRRIDLDEDFGLEAKEHPAQFRPASPGSPRKSAKSRPEWPDDDPIGQGRDMAADAKVPLPSDKVLNLQHGVRVLSPDSDEKDLEDLRRQGLLYDELSEEDLRLGDIVRDEPAYSIRLVARRKGKGRAAPDVGLEGETDDFFVPEDAFESWAEFAEQSGFEFVLVDDLVSNPESWVELDEL